MNLIILFLLFDLSNAHAGESGHEQILEQKNQVAEVYVLEMSNVGKGVAYLRLAWVPLDIESRCQGKSLTACHTIDMCSLDALAQKCNQDWSLCEPVVQASCQALGYTLQNFKKRDRTGPPYQLLEASFQIFATKTNTLKKMGLDTKLKGRSLVTIDAKFKQKVRLKWEHWTNGENFKVLELLD